MTDTRPPIQDITDAAVLCTLAQDPKDKVEIYDKVVAAVGLYLPDCPAMNFHLGILARVMGMFMRDTHPGLRGFEGQEKAAAYFVEAKNYLETAAALPQEDVHFSRASAKNALAQTYEDDWLPEGENLSKAFQLRLEAATDGLAEAQFNLGIMYYRGEGTEPSHQQASYWLKQATTNAKPLATNLRLEALQYVMWVEDEIASRDPAPERPAEFPQPDFDPFEPQPRH